MSSPPPDEPQPLVSILVPCFNAAPWLRECLDSCLAQQYSRTEVLVIDDGSTDGSREILEEYRERIQYRTIPNQGACSARNQLLEWARGEWIQFLDADDYLLPEKIHRQMKVVREQSQSVDVIYSPVVLRDDTKKPSTLTTVNVEPGQDPYLHYLQWVPFSSTGILTKKSAFAAVGGWKQSQPCCQEHELILRMLKAGLLFRFLNEAKVVYRIHGNGSISRKDPLRTIRYRMQFCEELEQYLRTEHKLTSRHSAALAASRICCARKAFLHDREFAQHLANHAVNRLLWRIPKTPSTPLLYRIAYQFFGFHNAERIAALFRR